MYPITINVFVIVAAGIYPKGIECRVNIAYGKHATQSSTINWSGYTWNANFALNNVTTFTDQPNCQCCSGTESTAPKYWQVDLGQQYDIGKIELYGRPLSPQSTGLKVYVSILPDDRSHLVYTVAENDNNRDSHFVINLTNPIGGRYVTITKRTGNILIVCEVLVYESCPDYHFEPNCEPCHCAGTPCNKSTGICSQGCKSGWSGNSCNRNPDISIALHKNVILSTTIPGWLPEYATDADKRTDADDCGCCAGTHATYNPWLQVDLGSRQKIASIYVHARTDKHDNNQLYTGLKVYLQQQSQISIESLVYTETRTDLTALEVVNATLDRPQNTQYVTIVLTGNDKLLVVCDLQVFLGVCRESYYGEDCDHVCHCKGPTCDDITGICPSGECQPGFQLPHCNIPCVDGFYGTCSQSCGECTTFTCNKTDGHCECNNGFMFPLCQTECVDGKYGHNCKERCGYCLDMAQCNNVDGTCTVCQAGYKGSKCDTPCNDGYYGDCTQSCGECRATTICKKTTGYCNDCKNGFMLPLCQTACVDGRYGINCSMKCGQCSSHDVCDKRNGSCPSGCDENFKLPYCQIRYCPSGAFGTTCEEQCGQCLNQISCDALNGHCGQCAAGYTGLLCKTECSIFSHGLNCSHKCGQCKEDSRCDAVTGICPSGCIEKYTGILCTARIESNSNNVVVVAVGCTSAGVVVVIIVVIGVVCYLKRQRNQKEEAKRRNNYTDLKVYVTPSEESPYATIKTNEVEHRYENVNSTSEPRRSKSKLLCGCVCERQ